MRHAIKDHEIQEVADSEPDYELPSPTAFFGSHVNSIPLQSAVQGPRLFYGARFYNQAMPVVNPEAPLVQNLDDTDSKGRSFDEIMGDQAGALRSKAGGEVVAVEPHRIVVKDAEGNVRRPVALQVPVPGYLCQARHHLQPGDPFILAPGPRPSDRRARHRLVGRNPGGWLLSRPMSGT